ncbi:hypothetical protein ACGFYF_42295 [Streptomyces lavendulae]|uniref:hypothetical protein n=1 Tax=Streptomyces lavendulae TaxID=1914 RepID=UPI003715A7C4
MISPHSGAVGYRPAPAGNAVAVTVSTLCTTALTATGTPVTDALLLVARAGVRTPRSGRPVREVIQTFLNSPS